MADRSRVLSAVLIAIVLISCSISGLAAGVYARHLGSANAPRVPHPSPVSSLAAAATATPAVPTATATATPRPLGSTKFVLTTSASPALLPPGQSFTVTVTAVTLHGGAPVADLQCFMRAPTTNHPALFQDWPPPKTTDARGAATWTLTAPRVPPGLYGVEIVAYGADSYNYYADALVTISG